MSRYIVNIPVSVDEPCSVEQSRSEPSPRAAASAMKAKVGAAASESQRATPRVAALAALALPAELLT